jgi:serine/threonine protein phosphatase PrpC
MDLKRLALGACVADNPMPGEIVCEAVDYTAIATDLAGGGAYACSFRSPTKQTPNEDSLGVFELSPHAAVLAVADGVGGHAGGEAASRLAIETLAAHLAPLAGLADDQIVEYTRPAILNAIEQANTLIQQLGTGAATTIALAEVVANTIRTYHVGDSAILVLGQRGRIKLETMAHSPVGYALGAGLLSREEAMFHEDRHIVENVLGTQEMRIEIGPPRELGRHDTLLIASDGLFDNLHMDEIVDGIKSGQLAKHAAMIVERCRARMESHAEDHPSKPDDLTAIVFRRCR